jgi:aminopeptidase N
MKTETPIPIRRQDYRPAPYRVARTELEFHLDEAATRVYATLHVERQNDTVGPLVLDGEHLKLLDIKLDGRPLSADAYEVTAEKLTIKSPPATRFRLDTTVEINLKANTALSGLYMSDGTFFKAMRGQGFRRITYSYDRPDNMFCLSGGA